jgi:hypothetical protein
VKDYSKRKAVCCFAVCLQHGQEDERRKFKQGKEGTIGRIFFGELCSLPFWDVYDELLEEANAKGGNAVVDVQLRNKTFFLWVFPTLVSTTWEATGTGGRIE